ncbi:hypothetical protein [Arthrobacter pigmenti]
MGPQDGELPIETLSGAKEPALLAYRLVKTLEGQGSTFYEAIRAVAAEFGMDANGLRRVVRTVDGTRKKTKGILERVEREISAIELGRKLASFVPVTTELARAVAFSLPIGERMLLALDSMDLGEDEDLALGAVAAVFERSDDVGRLKAIIEITREMHLQSANDLRHWVRAAEKLAVAYALSDDGDDYLLELYGIREEIMATDKSWN